MQNWSYARLSKEASKYGGPVEFIKIIAENGRKQGKIDMLPWLIISAAGASLITLRIARKQKQNEDEELHKVEEAKKALIKGIKEYDAKCTDLKTEDTTNK